MKAGTRTLWTFADHVDRALHGRARQPRRLDRATRDPRRSRRVDRAARVDRQRLHAHVRRLPAHRRGARRPLRSQAHVHDRRRHLHRRVGAAALAPSTDWLIAARAVQGLGAAIVTPLTLTILSAAVARRDARARARRVVGHRRARRRDGAARRRRRRRRHLVAVDLLAQRPGRARPAPARDCMLRESQGAGQGTRHPRPRARRALGLLGIVWGLVNGNADGWTSPRSSARSSSARSCSRRSSPGSCARRSRCSRCGSSATGRSRPRTARRCFMYFGMFGSIFLLSAVLPDRAGLLAARGRAAHPAVDGDADVRRPDRGRALRPHRRQAAHGDGSRAAGRRARVDRVGLHGDDRLRRRSSARSSSPAIGMGMFFAPVANVVLSAVRPVEEGKASGTNNAIREVGGVLRRRRAGVDLRPLRRVRVAADVRRRPRRRRSGSVRRSSPAARWSRSSSRPRSGSPRRARRSSSRTPRRPDETPAGVGRRELRPQPTTLVPSRA